MLGPSRGRQQSNCWTGPGTLGKNAYIESPTHFRESQFFEKASEAERRLHLIAEDVLQVESMQKELVKMLLLLDLDSDGDEYFNKLMTAFTSFDLAVKQFQSFVRSATVT